MSEETEQIFNTKALVALVKTVIKELIDEGSLNLNANETACKLAEINAKDNITAQEAAFLLGCSDSHIYNLLKAAEKGTSKRLIPYNDLQGVKTLPREQLLQWARPKIHQG